MTDDLLILSNGLLCYRVDSAWAELKNLTGVDGIQGVQGV